jgi:hypothetical protein
VKHDNMFTRLVANSSGPPEGQNENGCWPWTSSVTAKGYGRLNVRGQGRKHVQKSSHRVMETEMRLSAARNAADDAAPLWGPLRDEVTVKESHPDDETLDHGCWNRGCINPDHWSVVTRAENTQEMNDRRRST